MIRCHGTGCMRSAQYHAVSPEAPRPLGWLTMTSEVRPPYTAVPPPANLVAADAPSVLRTMNQRLLLELLFSSGPITRPQLARLSGLSQPTVIAALAGLE